MLKSRVIAFYISDHGFGHASRNIPIIRYILETDNEINIIVRTGENQGEFIKDSLSSSSFYDRISYYFNYMDVGLVLNEGNLDIDKNKLSKKVECYVNSFDKMIKKELQFLLNKNVDLVISDIVPWIFKCSKKLNIQSVLISNFTWVDIYEEYLSKEICSRYKECYELADRVLLYEFYMKEMKSYIKNYEEISLNCRNFNLNKVNEIKKKFKNKIVFLSVGRSVELKDEIDVSNLKYDFIVTDGVNIIGDNVYYLKKETINTQDYIMASDYIITKAGWSTVSEALLGKKKIALLSRDNVSEDRNTIKQLKKRGLAIEVKYEKDFNLENILNDFEVFVPKYEENNFRNDYKYIGHILMQIEGKKKSEKE